MAESYSIVYTYHIFFIHSSVFGHLGGSHVLAIVNSAGIKITILLAFWAVITLVLPWGCTWAAIV